MKKIKKYMSVLFICLMCLITSCSDFLSNNSYAKAEEYILENEYVTYENVKYQKSSLGYIVKEVVEPAEEVFIYPSINDIDVYSVAEGFLSDDSKIKVLNLPNSNIIYESKCVSNCVNLKQINLFALRQTSDTMNSSCEKKAFELEEDCYFYIQDAEYIQHYVYAFKPYVNKIKLLHPVKLSVSLSAWASGATDYKEESESLYFEVKGKLFGIIDVDLSQNWATGDVWSSAKSMTVIEDVDFFINNKDKIKDQNFEIKISAHINVTKAWIGGIVTKDYSNSYNKEYEKTYLSDHTFHKDGTPEIFGSFDTRFTYVNY